MAISNLTKSKKRIRDHGEVFTPDFVVEDMLDLVMAQVDDYAYNHNDSDLIKSIDREILVYLTKFLLY